MRKCSAACVKLLKRGQVTLSSVGKATTKRLREESGEERRRGRREEAAVAAAPQPLLWASCTVVPGEAPSGDPAPCTGDGCAERLCSATCVARPGLCCCCCCGDDVKRRTRSHQEDLTPSCAPSGCLCPAADNVISSGPVLYLCAASCIVLRPAARGCSCSCLRAPRLLLLTVQGSSVHIWITRREEEE